LLLTAIPFNVPIWANLAGHLGKLG
jgi:hypothetical protein